MLQRATSTESTYAAPKRLAAPVSTTVKKPNILARVYNALLNIPGNQISTPINTGRGVSMGGQQNVVQMTVEPVRQATRRAVGDVTAIPGIGKPSPSPTAADVRRGNYFGPVADYVTLASTVLPPAYEITKAALAAKMAKTIPDFPHPPAAVEKLPQVPSSMTMDEFVKRPEYASYVKAGQELEKMPPSKYAFDPEMAYLSHSGEGKLAGGVLDPNYTTGATSELNQMQLNKITQAQQSIIRSKETQNALTNAYSDFEKTGIWDGPNILNDLTGGNRNHPLAYGLKESRISNDIDLTNRFVASQMPTEQQQRVGRAIQKLIQNEQANIDNSSWLLNYADQGNFLSYYPADTGVSPGYLRSGLQQQRVIANPAMHIVGAPVGKVTDRFGPLLSGPQGTELQAFGRYKPLASILFPETPTGRPSGFVNMMPESGEMQAIRAFAVRKIMEDRLLRAQAMGATSRTPIVSRLLNQGGTTFPLVPLSAQYAQAANRAERAR